MKTFIDITIFTIQDKRLKVLLVKRKNEPFKNEWALPGGRIEENLSLMDSASFILENKINLYDTYMEQLGSFGDLGRDPRGRALSIAYLALIDNSRVKKIETDTVKEVQWFSVNKLPRLAFDHRKIIKFAEDRIVNKISYTRIGFDLIGSEFTLKDLAETFESILKIKIDSSNLKKKLIRLNVISETKKKIKNGVGRPLPIYRLNKGVLDALPITECLIKSR